MGPRPWRSRSSSYIRQLRTHLKLCIIWFQFSFFFYLFTWLPPKPRPTTSPPQLQIFIAELETFCFRLSFYISWILVYMRCYMLTAIHSGFVVLWISTTLNLSQSKHLVTYSKRYFKIWCEETSFLLLQITLISLSFYICANYSLKQVSTALL